MAKRGEEEMSEVTMESMLKSKEEGLKILTKQLSELRLKLKQKDKKVREAVEKGKKELCYCWKIKPHKCEYCKVFVEWLEDGK